MKHVKWMKKLEIYKVEKELQEVTVGSIVVDKTVTSKAADRKHLCIQNKVC